MSQELQASRWKRNNLTEWKPTLTYPNRAFIKNLKRNKFEKESYTILGNVFPTISIVGNFLCRLRILPRHIQWTWSQWTTWKERVLHMWTCACQHNTRGYFKETIISFQYTLGLLVLPEFWLSLSPQSLITIGRRRKEIPCRFYVTRRKYAQKYSVLKSEIHAITLTSSNLGQSGSIKYLIPIQAPSKVTPRMSNVISTT